MKLRLGGRNWAPLSILIAGLTACGGSANATPSPTAFISPAQATTFLHKWVQDDTAAFQAASLTQLAKFEEGPALAADTGQIKGTEAEGKPVTATPVSDSQMKAFIPLETGYPANFLVEVSPAPGSDTKSIWIFTKDNSGADWRQSVYLELDKGQSFPQFAVDSQGYLQELDASAQSSLAASAPTVATQYAQYLSANGWAEGSAPQLNFAPGTYTTAETRQLASVVSQVRSNPDVMAKATIGAQNQTWAFRTADGGAFIVFSITVEQIVAANQGWFVQSSDYTPGGPFVKPGNYSFLKSSELAMDAADVPAKSGPSKAVSVVGQIVQYTSGSGVICVEWPIGSGQCDNA